MAETYCTAFMEDLPPEKKKSFSISGAPATDGTFPTSEFTITRASCGNLTACRRRDSAGSQCQSPARRRAGGMWRNCREDLHCR